MSLIIPEDTITKSIVTAQSADNIDNDNDDKKTKKAKKKESSKEVKKSKKKEASKETVAVVENTEEQGNTDKFVPSIATIDKNTNLSTLRGAGSRNDQYRKIVASNAKISSYKTSNASQLSETARHFQEDAQEDANKAMFDDAPKGLNLDAESTNYYEQATGTECTYGFSTQNSINFTRGTEKSNTLINVTGNFSKDRTDSTGVAYIDPDTEDIVEDPNEKITSTEKSWDISVSAYHNRNNTIKVFGKDRPYRVAFGTDFMAHDNGSMLQGTIRGGIVDSETGMGITFDTTRLGVKTDEGWEKSIDTRCRVIVLDHKQDNITYKTSSEEETNEENSTNTTSSSITIKPKRRFGITGVIDNDKLGVECHYNFFDHSNCDIYGNYTRSQLIANGGAYDLTDNDEDRFKFSTGLEYHYKNVKKNNNYTTLDAEIGYEHVFDCEKPSRMLHSNVTFCAQRKRNYYELSGTLSRTQDLLCYTAGAKYNYKINNKFDLGASVDYSSENDFQGQPTHRLNGTLTLKYHWSKPPKSKCCKQ